MLKSNWVDSIAVHLSSRGTEGDVAEARKTGQLIVENGFSVVKNGGATVGMMGGLGYGVVETDGGVLQPITTKYFDISQKGNVPGALRAYVADSMLDRKIIIREGITTDGWNIPPSQICLKKRGGLGTFEEAFEWLNARNGHIYPLITDDAKYYEGLSQFFVQHAARGYLFPDFEKRYMVTQSPEEAVALMVDLNSKAAMPETDHSMDGVNLDDFITVDKNAIIVKPGPIPVMERISEILVGYDISNVKGQEVHPVDAPIKTIVFSNEGARGFHDGIEHWRDLAIAGGYMNEDRRFFMTFAADAKDRRNIVYGLNQQTPVFPKDLQSKQPEAGDSAGGFSPAGMH